MSENAVNNEAEVDTEEAAEVESAEPTFAEVSSATLASLKEKLVAGSQRTTQIYKNCREGILEVQNVANKLIAGGGGAAKAGNQVLFGLEKAAAVLDLNEVTPIFREAFADISSLVSAAQSAVEVAADESEDAIATCEMIRTELATNASRYNQLVLDRPESDLFPAVEGACDTFNTLNSPASVRSRIRFIRDKAAGVVGVAVMISVTTGESQIQAFYFTDYLRSCDNFFGRALNFNSTNEGGFVYKAVTTIAVATADAIVTAFGPLATESIDADANETKQGLRFASDSLDVVKELEGAADAEMDEEGTVVVEGAEGDSAPASSEDEPVDIIIEETGEASDLGLKPESEFSTDADGFAVEVSEEASDSTAEPVAG